MQKKKAVFNWSGGKDSALAFLKAVESQEYEIVSLLTTVNARSMRSTMHAIPEEVLRAQAQSVGLPIYVAELEPGGEMRGYNRVIEQAAEHFKAQGVTHFIFGDIFLHDVYSIRLEQMRPLGIEVVEPLWNLSTKQVMDMFIESGLKTIVVTTMADKLGEEYIGRLIDHDFVESLPNDVDICGELGEYHTLCYDGKIFKTPINYTLGEPFKYSNEVKLDTGEVKVFSYWSANINPEN